MTKNVTKEKRKVEREEIIALIKNTIVMLLIAVVAGGILGYVNEITKEPIAATQAKLRDEANKKVFFSADSFSDNIITDEMIKNYMSDVEGVDIKECLEAYDSNKNLLGYVLEVTSHEGYGGDIVFRVGICSDGLVNGISITSISETAGLGMRADEVLVPQFKNKNVSNFEVTKSGSVASNQIDAITSATITSKAVTKGVNTALDFFRDCLIGGGVNEF